MLLLLAFLNSRDVLPDALPDAIPHALPRALPDALPDLAYPPLLRPVPPPHLRPGWTAPGALPARSACADYVAVEGDTCAQLAYWPGANVTVGPLFITHKDTGALCRTAIAEPAANETMTICRRALQATIGTFPQDPPKCPGGPTKACNATLPPPSLDQISPCYNQLLVFGVHDVSAAADDDPPGTYSGCGALEQISANLTQWKRAVPGRQVLLLVDNMLPAADPNASFASLLRLANEHNADGFAFGNPNHDYGFLNAGGPLGKVVGRLKTEAPWIFVSFISNHDMPDFVDATVGATAIAGGHPDTVDTVSMLPGGGEDARFETYPYGGRTTTDRYCDPDPPHHPAKYDSGPCKTYPTATIDWRHASYYTFTKSACYVKNGIGLMTWSNAACAIEAADLYGVLIDGVENELGGYSCFPGLLGEDEECGHRASPQTALHSSGCTTCPCQPVTCGNPVTTTPTGACHSSAKCCPTDYAIQQWKMEATCKMA